MTLKKISKILRRIRSGIRYVWRRRETGFDRSYIDSVLSVDGVMKVKGHVYSTNKIENIDIIFRKFREESKTFRNEAMITPAPLRLILLCLAVRPIMKVYVKSFVAMPKVDWRSLPNSIYSFNIETGLRRFGVVFPERANSVCRIDEQTLLYAYRDPVVGAVRIEKMALTDEQVSELSSYRVEPAPSDFPVFLVCEYTNSAKDNGWALFEHLSESSGAVSAYVVEAANSDGVVADGRDVLAYGSMEHLKYCLDSDLIAFSHHRTYGYPYFLREIRPERYDATKTLFIQHGVMALKRSPLRHYRQSKCKYDGVCVSSTFEKKIFERDFLYDADQVFITGLARHDHLRELAASSDIADEVLIFPTWRQGLEKLESDEAAKSMFFQSWISAIEAIKRSVNLNVRVILHPIIEHHRHILSQYADAVDSAASFQECLSRAACLITDYSSVAFEAVYAGKKVYFFHFDTAEIEFNTSAFIDVEKDMPGEVATNAEQLASMLGKFSRSGGINENKLADKYFDYFDNGSAERIEKVMRKMALDGRRDYLSRPSRTKSDQVF